MKRRKMLSILLFAVLLLDAACSQHPAGNPEDKSSSSIGKDSVATTDSQITLDVVINGPFTVLQQKDGLLVLLPVVEGHNKPVAVTSGDFANIKTLEPGDYEFTQGVRPSAKMTVLTAVKETSILQVSATKEMLPVKRQETPYLSIKMPLPREVAGWNADPLEVSNTPKVCGPSNMSGQKYATMIILRYDAKKTDLLQMTGQNFTWQPIATPQQTERIVAISAEPVENDDQHVHACNAFKHQTNMLGLKRYVAFPPLPSTYGRNGDLIPGALPDELVQLLSQNDTQLKENKSKRALARSQTILGGHNDCKSPLIWVLP